MSHQMVKTSHSLIYTFLNSDYISFFLFLAVLPLHFLHYIQSSTSYPYILYTIFMEVLLLYISYAISMAIWSLVLMCPITPFRFFRLKMGSQNAKKRGRSFANNSRKLRKFRVRLHETRGELKPVWDFTSW